MNKSSCQTGSHDMVSVTLATFHTKKKIQHQKISTAIWPYSVSVKHEELIQSAPKAAMTKRQRRTHIHKKEQRKPIMAGSRHSVDSTHNKNSLTHRATKALE